MTSALACHGLVVGPVNGCPSPTRGAACLLHYKPVRTSLSHKAYALIVFIIYGTVILRASALLVSRLSAESMQVPRDCCIVHRKHI